MTSAPLKSSLTPAARRLVELMQRINFGTIEDLPVRRGQPVLDPLPRYVTEVKFGGENGARPELMAPDFPLKAQVVELIRRLADLGDGTVAALEIKHGIPFRMLLTSPPR
ncbi:hypothetical protein [Fimbriiglobus ruber]|uniref:Uncharacterized protein n=1 Tax=Fimbriiglobus ruber TaxID=1908690 RepID=A0A225DUQ6_9BACT|nr:hypothetical protein [Fimbriiglobus ruber]OWK39877.1 hypothetical protein FRUB_05767 [Fimbriiglobus ruber]